MPPTSIIILIVTTAKHGMSGSGSICLSKRTLILTFGHISTYVHCFKYFELDINTFLIGWHKYQNARSVSIFPSNVVTAMPSVRSRFDRNGAPTPFIMMAIENDGNGDVSLSVISRYTSKTQGERTFSIEEVEEDWTCLFAK